MPKTVAPFGSWESAISAEMVGGKNPKLTEPLINQQRIFWLESRPEEKGRIAIMMHSDSQSQCILPHPLSAKSKVHEYGGGSYAIHGNTVYFVLADDQQIYKADFTATVFDPVALTENPTMRFADLHIDTKHSRILAVCEDHSNAEQEPSTRLVSVPLDGSKTLSTIHQGFDFYSFPRISPNGESLSWSCWNHPNMPWDNTELWLADILEDGIIGNATKIQGNGEESIFQPQWSPDNELYFVSDRSNWWNIYQYDNGKVEPVFEMEAEFATPQWTFNMSTYDFIDEHSIFATYTKDGSWYLCQIDRKTKAFRELNTAATQIFSVHAENGVGVYVGASPQQLPNIYHYHDNNDCDPLIKREPLINAKDISEAQAITFPTSHDQFAHAFYYPPVNSQYKNPSPPPMIVVCHGGPTGTTGNNLDLRIQYWTNRGFAVMDVNYRGSTGYGREFRQLLHNNWGIYDVDDVCAVADYAVENGLAAKGQCIIKGSSAGGYTVLATLAFRDTFDCGVSLYGIGDLETLARDTHKFEARYLDSLIGQYPEEKHIYVERSPIHKVENINCPLLVFQGLEDKVVPPNQAEEMVSAVENNKQPVAYVTFADEAHGFRQAENIRVMLDAELEFYSRLFGFPTESKELHIRNFEK